MAGIITICESEDKFTTETTKDCEGKLIVVDFTASWCGPCRFIAPFVQELARKYKEVKFLKVDVDKLESIAKQYNVEAMPTFVFLKDGNKLDTVVGAKKDELQKAIGNHTKTLKNT